MTRFMKRVSKPDGEDGCWLWDEGRDKDGYGLIYSKEHGGLKKAHRVAYILFKGAIPDGLCVLQTPVIIRTCVNPKSIFGLVTSAQ